VLAIGTRLSELTTLGYAVPGPGAKLIHIDISPEVLGQSYPATVAIAADAGFAIRGLTMDADGYDWPAGATARNTADHDAYVQAIDASAGGVSELVDPAVVVKAMAKWLPDDAVTTADAGNFFGWVQRFSAFRRPGTFLGPTSGAMGYAVPAAVAATIVHQGKVPVVATAGDGGFFMTGNELAVAAQLGLPVICVVFNNALYGTIRLHQEREYPGRVSGTELWTPDIVKYAEAFGGKGIRIEHDADAEDAIREALAHNGITVIDVAVSRETIAPGVKLSGVSAS
jgi:acetolactate synthase-1/2/3 large subunit